MEEELEAATDLQLTENITQMEASRHTIATIKALYRSSGTRYSADEEPAKKKR